VQVLRDFRRVAGPPMDAPLVTIEPLGLTMLMSPLTTFPLMMTGVAFSMLALSTLPFVGSVSPG